MVQVIQKYDPMAHLGQLFGQGAGQGFSKQADVGIKRQQTRNALDSLNNNASNPVDLAKNLLSATAGLDDQGRILQALFQPMLSQMNMKAEQAADLTGNKANQADQNNQADEYFDQKGNVISRKEPLQKLPSFLNRNKNDKFFPTNLPGNEKPGNLPQTATQGTPRAELTGDQLLDRASDIQRKWGKAGLIKTLDEAYKVAERENEQNRIYNQKIEEERQQRVNSQEKYGDLAVTELKRLVPDATSEQEAIFRKEAEEEAGKNKSEADIKRHLAKSVTKFKNTISSVKEGLEAPRIQNKLSRGVLGTSSTLKQAQEDARGQIQPLLDKGLYDTARTLLSGAKFYPEERENIIFGELPKNIKENVNQITKPKIKENYHKDLVKENHIFNKTLNEKIYEPESFEALKDNILNLFKNEQEHENKQVNLIQLRKLYEDKNYDWRVYKDALNELVGSGDISLTDDQQTQYNRYLNEPPLDNIGKILYSLKLRGR